MVFGQRCAELRKKKGYTRTAFADKLGIPHTTLRNYELGIHEPGHSFLVQVAREFGVTTDYLLGLTDSPIETKKSPAPVMPETGESKSVRASLFYQQLIAAGYLREGEDFTTAQIRILKSVLEILDATFPKRNIPEGDEAREIG